MVCREERSQRSCAATAKRPNWAGHAASMEMRNACNTLVENVNGGEHKENPDVGERIIIK
jgi:hypothetical protein